MSEEEIEAEDGSEELFADISQAVAEYRSEMDDRKHLSYVNPERAANILYRWSIGWSQTRLKREMKVMPVMLRTLLVDYADRLGKWQELGSRIASKSYVRMSLLEDEVMENLEKSVSSGKMEVSFVDLKNLSIAKSNSHREALLARGHATSITEERKVVTAEDYEETARKARERLEGMKRVEEVESE